MIQQRSLLEILDTAFAVVRQRTSLLFGIAIVYCGLPMILVDVVLPGGSGDDGFFTPAVAVSQFVQSVPGCFATYASSWTLMRIAGGSVPRLGEALASPFASPGLLPLALVYSLATTIGVLALLIPALLFWAALLPVFSILAVESGGGVRAVQRAWTLTSGHRRRALGLVFAIFLLSLPILGISLLLDNLPDAFGVAVTGLAIAAYSALGDTATFFFYVDVRSRKEAFDLTHLASIVEIASESNESSERDQ